MTPAQYVVGYLTAMVTLGLLDTGYILLGGLARYRKFLGPLLKDPVAIKPAIPLYLLAIAGYVYFAIGPGVEAGSLLVAVGNSMFLGLLYFAFYEFTNLATIKGWSWYFALSEIAWGIFASAILGTAAFFAARWVG